MPAKPAVLPQFRTIVLTALVIFALTVAEISLAGEDQQPEPAPTVEPVPTAEPIPTAEPVPTVEPAATAEPATSEEPAPPARSLKEKMTDIKKTVDEAHQSLDRSILKQAIRLDRFFGNAKTEDQRPPEFLLRVRNFLRIEERESPRFGISVRGNVVLSSLSERLRLTIAGEKEQQPFAPSLPEDPGNPGFDRTSSTTRLINTELRYGLIKTPATDVFLGAGIRLVFPPEAFVRGRYQYTHHLSDVSLVRFAETLFVKNTVGIGETTEIDLERLLNQQTILRLATAGTASHETSGVEWGSELSLIRELSSLSAITLMAGVYGNTSVDDVMNNYRLLARYRRNFLRSWLFYELQPEISWPRREDGKFPPKLAFTFLLEVVFEGTAAEKDNKSGLP